MLSDVSVDEAVPGSQGVESADQHHNLLGNGATGGGSEGGVQLHLLVLTNLFCVCVCEREKREIEVIF